MELCHALGDPLVDLRRLADDAAPQIPASGQGAELQAETVGVVVLLAGGHTVYVFRRSSIRAYILRPRSPTSCSKASQFA